MQLDNRIGWLLLGGVAGFALGYIVRSFQESRARKRGLIDAPPDGGFFRSEVLNRIALGLVVLLVAYSSFRSQQSSNEVKAVQASRKAAAKCAQDFLAETISALNARTQYSPQTNAGIVALFVAQAEFLSGLIKPPGVPVTLDQAALTKYTTVLRTYIVYASKTGVLIQKNPYPTNHGFLDCVQKG